METLLLTARLVLALVFILAGVMKLADVAGSAKASREFGVPESLAKPIGILLPLSELTIAVVLISAKYAWWGAVAALLLLLAFIGAISINLWKGRAPNCNCFGQLSSDSIGFATLLRNQMLAAVAGLLIWQGWNDAGPAVSTWLRDLTPGDRIRLTACLIGLAVFVGRKKIFQLLSRRSSAAGRWAEAIQNRLPLAAGTATFTFQLESTGIFPAAGSPVGTMAPNSEFISPDNQKINLHTLLDDRLLMLVFVDPACDPCRLLLPEINHWASRYSETLTISIVTRNDLEDRYTPGRNYYGTKVFLQKDSEVAQAFQVVGFPSAVMVRPNGIISSRLALGAEAIRGLLTDFTGRRGINSMPSPPAAHTPCGTCGH